MLMGMFNRSRDDQHETVCFTQFIPNQFTIGTDCAIVACDIIDTKAFELQATKHVFPSALQSTP